MKSVTRKCGNKEGERREDWTTRTNDKSATFRDVYQLGPDNEKDKGRKRVERRGGERERERGEARARKEEVAGEHSTGAGVGEGSAHPEQNRSHGTRIRLEHTVEAVTPLLQSRFHFRSFRSLVIIHWNTAADAETQFKSATLSSQGGNGLGCKSFSLSLSLSVNSEETLCVVLVIAVY